jgi:hypothetical protein
LSLILDGTSDSFSCKEDRIGWSEPIRSQSDGKTIDASRFDWSQELRMQSPDKRWRFKLPAFPIRVFVTGEGEGLSGLIEVRQLPKNSRFYLAARQECCQLLETWGESSCKGFKKLQIAEGLPRGWHFFYADAAYSDELFKREYPILSWPTTIRLDLQGGIRLDKGNRFFKFAPPKLVLQGGNESVKVYCNNQLLDCTQTEGIYELPGNTPPGTRLIIEARIGEEVIGRRSLSLVEDFSLPDQRDTQKFDGFGYRQTNLDPNQMGVAGALVCGFNSPPFNFNTLLPVQGKRRILFVGKEPGQVTNWPEERLPTDWSPVWAIAIGRLFDRAMFCGTSLKESEPTLSRCRDREKLHQWKQIFWDNRNRTLPPMDSNRLQALWKTFQKEARLVKR